MEGDALGGREKRSDMAKESRVRKARREGDGESSVSDVMLWEPTLAEMGCDRMVDMGFPLTDSLLVFLNASAEAVSAFDLSGLTGVSLSKEFIGPEEGDAEAPADVFVLGVVRPVDISRQMIFREILRRLHLKVYDIGIVIEAPDVYRAWIDMETPRSETNGSKGRKKLYGQGSDTRYGAVESVCAVGTMHLCVNHHVVVKDFSYLRMKMLEGKVRHEKQWTSMVRDLLEKEQKTNEKLKRQHKGVVNEGVCICSQFGDVLPIRVCCDGDVLDGTKNLKFVYGGERPPASRLEELAFALVNLVSNADATAMSKE